MTIKTKQKFTTIPTDENGRHVFFQIPRAAMWYDMACTKLKEQDKVDDTIDELIEIHYGINEN